MPKLDKNDNEIRSLDEMWDELIELGVSQQTLQIVSNGWGYSTETLETVLYVHTGLRSFDQIEGGE